MNKSDQKNSILTIRQRLKRGELCHYCACLTDWDLFCGTPNQCKAGDVITRQLDLLESSFFPLLFAWWAGKFESNIEEVTNQEQFERVRDHMLEVCHKWDIPAPKTAQYVKLKSLESSMFEQGSYDAVYNRDFGFVHVWSAMCLSILGVP